MAETGTTTALAVGLSAGNEAAWRALVEKVVKGAEFERRLVARSADGIAVGPLYTRQDGVGVAETGIPGAAPYTRGFVAAGSRAGWQIRQVHAGADAAALRAALAEDVTGGVAAVTIKVAAAGQTGLAASALRDVVSGLSGVQVFIEPGAAALDAAVAVAGIGGIAGLGIDPVGTLARTGETSLLAADSSARFTAAVPWIAAPATTLLADGRPFHEAGGSEAQELAGMLGALVLYLRAMEAAGVAPVDGLPRIALTLAADADLFLTIAKLRSGRRLVGRIAEACGAGSAAGHLRLAVTTSERMMSRRDPWVNLLRTTAAAAGAAIGGADAIGVLPYTWPLGQPDGFARRIARNSHHVLAEESGLARVADPAGGAWAVERLTEELAQKAWAIFQDWESKGGIVAALRSGIVAEQIGEMSAARAQAIATGKLALTGTSSFPMLGNDGVTVVAWPAAPACKGALLPAVRLAEPFERLRDAADAMGGTARVFIAALGAPAEHAARATWVANLLAAGGIAVIHGDGFTSSVDVGRAFAESGARVACICGTDEAYVQQGEAVAGVLKQAGARRVYVAGRPADQALLKSAGVDGFWFAGADLIALLAEVQGAMS